MSTFPTTLDGRFEDMMAKLQARVSILEQQQNAGASTVSTWSTFAASAHSSAQKPATSNLTLSTSAQDVPGATATFTVTGAHSVAMVVGTFDVAPTTSSAGVIVIGTCVVDGVVQASQAIWTDNGANSRATVTQSWQVALGTGSHTIKLQGTKFTGGVHLMNANHTNLNVLVMDLV